MAATLLLADDSVTIQRVIELTFADEDVTVIAVGDGDAAIARVEEHPPDIVLADVGMPGKNGYEVASYIKHSPRLAHIPVILLTGAFEPVDQRRASEAGCDSVLAKPFEPQLVISRVRELLGRAPHMLAVPQAGSGAPSAVPRPAALEPARPAPAVVPAAPLDDFFDELDAAFAKLPGARSETPAFDDGLDLGEFGTAPPETPADSPERPPSVASPRDDVDRAPAPRETTRDEVRGTEPASRQPAPPPQAMPALAEAFAALLAAEQPGAPPADTAAWSPPVTPVVNDELVERVAQLVIERLSDRVVRDTVADIVSAVAERLVRDEIDRIKTAIK